MTCEAVNKIKKCIIVQIPTVLCLGFAVTMILMADRLRGEIYNGFLFSFTTVIPTLFPFFILSDLWSALYSINPKGFLSRNFERLFGIRGCAFSALISGYFCGFPVGAKVASQLYTERKITKDELERLIGFTNNPSLAFVVSGVGAGMLGNIFYGLILYFSIILSSMLTGIIFRRASENISEACDNSRQSFNLIDSIKSAGLNSLNVASCIVFFSGVLGLISGMVKNEGILLSFSVLCEVTNAIKLAVKSPTLSLELKLIISAFALGFSGLSVHLQAFSFIPSDVSKIRYFIMKLTQGFIASIFIFILIRSGIFKVLSH